MASTQAPSLKGINYDVGTNFMPQLTSQARVGQEQLRGDFQTIRNQLHCNAIQLYGTHVERLEECAMLALEHDLKIWIQPRLIDASPEEVIAHLGMTARMAERLRAQWGEVTLDIGCELTMFMSGIMPGRSYGERGASLLSSLHLIPQFNEGLNKHLGKAVAVARAEFKGEVTYAAAPWEAVEWAPFDIVGVDHYMMSYNQDIYVDQLKAFHRYQKPVVVTEFGCCSYDGAAEKGPAGYEIVDWSKPQPEIAGDHVRNERVQADYISKLFRIFRQQAVQGCFVYTFSDPDRLYSPDARRDLDMAGFGVVRVVSSLVEGALRWEPKAAFHEIARLYGE